VSDDLDAPAGQGLAERPQLTRQWLRQLYLEDGLSADAIADLCGWSSQYVRNRLRENSIPLRRPGAPGLGHADLSAEMVGRLLTQGLTVAQIADRTGYSRSGVYKLIRKGGLPTRRPRRPLPEGALAEVLSLYEQGETLDQIGERFERGPAWVRARLREAGVEPRSAMQRRAVSPERVQALILEGRTVPEIANVTGRAPQTIYDLLRTRGWTAARPASRRLPPLSPDLVVRLHVDEGLTVTGVAKLLHCSSDRVRRALDTAGISPQRMPIRKQQLLELYVEQKLPIRQVAGRLECSSTRVAAALDRYEIPRHADPFAGRRVPPIAIDAATLTRLYIDKGLDDKTIAELYQVPPVRIRRRREELGVRRPSAPPPHSDQPDPPAPEELERLYVAEKTPIAAIARQHHTSSRVVRLWLTAAGIPVQPRTARAHRRDPDPQLLRERYEHQKWGSPGISVGPMVRSGQ